MLYHVYDAGRRVAEPMAELAGACATLVRSGFGIGAIPAEQQPLARQFAAGWELLYRLGKRYERPRFGLDGVLEAVVAERPFCRLLHLRQEHCSRALPAVLVAAPLSGHHATLLRETVRELLHEHEVYITDWIDAREVPLRAGSFGLDDYVAYLQDFMRLLAPELHVVAVCQAAVPLLGAVALMASEGDACVPRSMTLIGGPVDTRRQHTAVNQLAMRRPLSWFREAMIHAVPAGHPGAGRLVYPGFLQHACFVWMNAERHADSHRDFYRRRSQGLEARRHCEFYDEYNATLDLPAEFYLDTIDTVFQQHRLANGSWTVKGKAVRPQDIRGVALLTIEGERDDITAPGQTAAALELCSGIARTGKRSYVAPDCGHYAIFSGRHWREHICPMIGDFIRCHTSLPHAA